MFNCNETVSKNNQVSALQCAVNLVNIIVVLVITNFFLNPWKLFEYSAGMN